jgi:hypothetical protein
VISVCKSKQSILSAADVVTSLEGGRAVFPADVVELVDGSTVSIASLDRFGKSAIQSMNVEDASSVRSADIKLAQDLHESLGPIRDHCPWLLNAREFWEWLAFCELGEYALARWCGGSEWLINSEISRPKDSALERFLMLPDSVHSQSRHVIRRLYIYADCSFSFDGTYDHIPVILAEDLDIPGAVFERKLGLSPTLAVALCRAANKLGAVKKTDDAKAISARSKRRKFFKQVNLLVSSVAMEFLSDAQIDDYLNGLVAEINSAS